FRPIIRAGGSDSAALDNVADFLVASGRSLPQVMMMLVPEAWVHDPAMSPEKKAFYEYHGCLVEPWDGPAALCFTDGVQIGATLDRNGLRPAKYVVTNDGLVVLASELGVLSLDPKTVVEKGRLQPGKMFLVDVDEGRIVSDEEIKQQIAKQKPYRRWLDANKIDLGSLPPADAVPTLGAAEASTLRHAFGYTEEDVRAWLTPMAQLGEEPTGSMGADVALACLSPNPQSLFRYFKQHFAQVTNPPIDPIREELVMSLVSCVGPEGNLLEETPRQCRMIELPHPFLTDDAIARLRQSPFGDFPSATLDMVFPVAGDAEEALREGLHQLTDAAERAVRGGARVLILSDRKVDSAQAPIPSVLATGAVHHALMRAGLRVRAGLLVESAEPREVSHLALLIGFGAGGVNPYLALATVAELASQGLLGDVTPEVAQERYIKALKKGLLKVMSKMGISSLGSYQGAQIFEAVGIDQIVVDEFFTGTASRIRGVGLAEIAADARARHAQGFDPGAPHRLPEGGHLHYRVRGEKHLWTPETIATLQKAVRLGDAKSYEEYARLINEQGPYPATLRGLWDLSPIGPAVPLDEVEPAKELVKRFATGAMS
ncbi:MAG TPA: glutamate synthase central domain-containing protein, partial [Polyangiaceae bacterium]